MLLQYQLRILVRHLDKPSSLTALRYVQVDTPTPQLAKPCFDNLRLLYRHRQQDVSWDESGLGIVLLEKGCNQFTGLFSSSLLKEEVFTPHQLAAANKVDLDADGGPF